MRIKLGSIITDASGKLGGHVAKRDRSGLHLVTKTSMVSERMVNASRIVNPFTEVNNLWRNLNPVQRRSWIDFSPRETLPRNHFIRVNTFRLSAKEDPILTLIGPVVLPVLRSIFTCRPSVVRINFGQTIVPNDLFRIAIFASRPVGQVITNKAASYIFNFRGRPFIETSRVFTVPYIAIFGALPQLNAYVGVRLILYHQQTGQMSTPLFITDRCT